MGQCSLFDNFSMGALPLKPPNRLMSGGYSLAYSCSFFIRIAKKIRKCQCQTRDLKGGGDSVATVLQQPQLLAHTQLSPQGLELVLKRARQALALQEPLVL